MATKLAAKDIHFKWDMIYLLYSKWLRTSIKIKTQFLVNIQDTSSNRRNTTSIDLTI